MSTESLEPMVIDAQNAVQIFTGGGMAAILDGIEAKVRAINLDLDALKEEVRKPLTDFEDKEKVRVAAHEAALADITGLHAFISSRPDLSLDELVGNERDFREMLRGHQWEEFTQRAQDAKMALGKYLSIRIEERKRYEVEQEELARLRKAEAERIEEARAKREADQRLRRKIRSEIVADLIEKSAEEIADAILSGHVRHVKVVF